MQRSIVTQDGQPYLCEVRLREGRVVRELSPLNPYERVVLQAALAVRETLAREIITVPCSAPGCRATIPMTRRQFSDLSGPFSDRYGKTVRICCSRECQEEVEKQMREAGYAPTQRKNIKPGLVRERGHNG